jgi:MFS family permease
MTKEKRTALLAWFIFGLVLITNLAAIIYRVYRPAGQQIDWTTISFPLVPVLFALVGALIVSRHPRNVIGLVMMLPGLSFAFLIDVIAPATNGQAPPPANPSNLFLWITWFSNWNWMLLVLPVMFIMLLFPTGKSLTRRWNWAIYFGIGLVGLLVFLSTFAEVLTPNVEPIPWSFPNPIGFLDSDQVEAIASPFFILFPAWILTCIISLFLRFRRARGVEREQIKWLFYAAAMFFLLYMPSFIGNTYYVANNFWNLLLPIGMATFPLAIGIAILRYRLYDIDIIIRKTLQYAILTGLLALVYFGSVILLQSLTENLFGEQSPLVIVLSTLGIAALFNPLRTRIQDFIDLRFYRKKYDAEQALAQFAATARDEVDMDQLNAALLQVVEQTVQPESVSLWLHQRKRS